MNRNTWQSPLARGGEMGSQIAQALWVGAVAFTAEWIVSGLQWLRWCQCKGVTLDGRPGGIAAGGPAPEEERNE